MLDGHHMNTTVSPGTGSSPPPPEHRGRRPSSYRQCGRRCACDARNELSSSHYDPPRVWGTYRDSERHFNEALPSDTVRPLERTREVPPGQPAVGYGKQHPKNTDDMFGGQPGGEGSDVALELAHDHGCRPFGPAMIKDEDRERHPIHVEVTRRWPFFCPLRIAPYGRCGFWAESYELRFGLRPSPAYRPLLASSRGR
jgi:hypothetical protein